MREKMATKKKTVSKESTPSEKPVKQKKVQQVWPQIIVGTHLTVKRYEDGYTELEWDDAALLREIQEATK